MEMEPATGRGSRAGDDAFAQPGVKEPVVVIEAVRGWGKVGLKDLWANRELVLFFSWRDVKVRYKQTVLGVAWAVLQPLVTMALFYVVFYRVAHVQSDGVPYVAFAMAGVAAWVFISNGFTLAANGLVSNANLLAKVYFPRLALPVGSVIACLVDLTASLLITEIVLLVSGVGPTWRLAVLPLCVVLATGAALGLGVWLSALQVYYRDIKYVLPLLTQALLFATPIAYSASVAHGALKVVLLVNPVSAPVEAFRWSLLGQGDMSVAAFGFAASVTALLFMSGLLYFGRAQRAFADVV